nr:hypothetical protein [Tanacetum cinerariifolium]
MAKAKDQRSQSMKEQAYNVDRDNDKNLNDNINLNELTKKCHNELTSREIVIEFGDSYEAINDVVATGLTTEGTSKKKGMTVALTTKDMQKRKNDTFGGNEATKKTKKNMLKQQYGNFKAEGSETLEQNFNRLQAIVSHLQFMDIEIEQDDLNQKLLTSLAPEWLMHTIVWRNRSDLDMMSLHDLYNHLKVYEFEVQKKSESNSQNMAFISSAKNSNGKEDVNTTSIPTTSTNVSPASVNIGAVRVSVRTLLRTGKKISIQGTDVAGFDKLKVKCFNCHKMGHFARECRAPRSQDRGRRDNYRHGSKVEEHAPKALMEINGVGWDWSFMANEEDDHALVANEETLIEFALMAKTSADSEVFDNSLCSNTCLSQVESRLVEFKNQEVEYRKKIRGLEFKVEARANRIECLTNELELLKKEKEGLESKLTGFQSASKDLDSLLESQRSDKNKEGLGYSAVSPLLLLKPSPAIESTSDDVQNRNPFVTETEASPSTISSKPFIKFVKAADRPTKDKTDKYETAKKPTVKCAESYRKTTKRSNVRGNQRNRNNLKSQQLGKNFVMKKACYKCGSVDHLSYNYGKRVDHRSSWVKNNNTHKSKTPRTVFHKTDRPPMRTNRPYMNAAQPKRTSFYKPAHSYNKRPFQRTSAVRSQFRGPRVPTVNRKFPTVNRKFPTGNSRFSTADQGNKRKAVKASACWIWKPSQNLSNKECIVLGQNFKLTDDTNVLLRTPKQHNMYTIDLNNIVPHKDLTSLVAKASADECMLWHMRLGHLNFKTMNKLVRHNLVRGLLTKFFENDHNCTACLKGKQHKASCKTKFVNSVTKPLHTLHMDLCGPTSVSSLNHKWYCLVVTDDRFTWTFFLKTKDETSGILRNFITEIENLKELRVKIIRCDNRGEFRNKEMNDFCSRKGIKRKFSNARTPQQNGVAKRRNIKLIEAARTMVLVNKSQNKTLYELFNGRTPAVGFLKPFGCHVMILNTLDNLGKFEAKRDEGYFIRYSMSSKSFRVFNKRTKRIEENLYVDFLGNKPIEKGAGPNWLFDIDSLTNSMNYVPVVVAGTNSTNFSGTKEAAGQDVKKDVSSLRYIVLPNWLHKTHLETSTSNAQDACNADASKSSGISNPTATSTNPSADHMETLAVETPIPTVSSPVPIACLNDSPKPSSYIRLISKRVTSQDDTPSLDNILTLTNRFEGILEVTTNTDDTNRVEADLGNMETTIIASPTPTLRIYKDHPKSQIIGPVDTPIQTRNKSKEMEEQMFIATIHQKTNLTLLQFCLFSCFLSQVEPKKIYDALQYPSWVEAMKEELFQFKIQNVWSLVDCPKGVRPIGTKWVLKNKKDERGIVIRNKAMLVAQWHAQKERIDYDEVFAPVARIEAIRLFLAYASFMGFTTYQMDVKSAFLYGTIDEEVYVMQPPRFYDPEFPARVYKVEKAMYGLHQTPRAWSSMPCAALSKEISSSILLLLILLGEGSGTPTEPHHTPIYKASQSSQHELPSPSLPPVTTGPLPTVTPFDTPQLSQYTRRARIAQSSVLPPVENEPASPIGDKSEGEACPTDSGLKAYQDRANIPK